MAIQRIAAGLSSIAIRIASLVYFRFFPGHMPSAIFALFAVYVPSFLASYFTSPQVEVVADEVDISVKETAVRSADAPQEEVVAEELNVQETVVLAEKAVSPWKILLFGAPSARRPLVSLLSFLVNLALVGLTVDALFRARWYYPADDLSLVRLGYVSHTEVKFLIREPDQAKLPVILEIRPKDSPSASEVAIWKTAGTVGVTGNETDFTSVVATVLPKSSGQQMYEWRTSNNHTGEFLTPPQPGKMPDYNGGKFTFLSTSCILPGFPYNPLDHPLAIPGLRHLAKKLPELGVQFMLFLGDFIYVDVPELFATSVDEYRMQYRQVYASPDWAAVGQNLSWIHTLDDHDIINSADSSANTAEFFKNAMSAWHTYQGATNPPQAMAAGTTNHRRRDATWFEFVQGPASFFMIDTRCCRSSNSLPFDDTDKTMLGADQLADLLAWLGRPEPKGVRWKIVASSIPFTKNWPVDVRDTWGGFLVERRKVLEAMWDVAARGQGVVVVSGDRHEFAATSFPPPAESEWSDLATVHEFSTSPLNQFTSPFPTYRQTDDEEVMLKYHHSGRSKFGSFTIENVDGESTLHYRLFVDGEETWNTTITAPPVPEAEDEEEEEEVVVKGSKKSSGSFWDKIWFI